MSKTYVLFSHRVGARTLKILGMKDVPEALRLSLWNVIQPWMFHTIYQGEYMRRAQWIYNFHAIKWPTDEIPDEMHSFQAQERLKDWLLFRASWDELYDFVEALPLMVIHGYAADPDDMEELGRRSAGMLAECTAIIHRYIENLNLMLAREGSPYRYQSGQLVAITNEHELGELTQAIENTPFRGAQVHLANAAGKLSQRPEPDYRNSIKESVSAVESLLQEATGFKGEKLPKLLDAFEKKFGADLHRAFKSALGSLYGWSSDESGIRHGIFGDENVGEAEARLMLITCSALVNFLIMKTS